MLIPNLTGKLLILLNIDSFVAAGFFSPVITGLYSIVETISTYGKTDLMVSDTSPQLKYRPNLNPLNINDNLIWYKAGCRRSARYWIEDLDKFLKPYLNFKHDEHNLEDCTGKNEPEPGRVCQFKLVQYEPCTHETGYGFLSRMGGPCLFLTLSPVAGWIPEYYNSTNLPSEMPEHLQERVINEEKDDRHHIVWVDCVGRTDSDRENIGPIFYHPRPGFEKKYFPFTKDDLSPVVVVHFERPRRGVLLEIECKAWAPNIDDEKFVSFKSVNINLMVN